MSRKLYEKWPRLTGLKTCLRRMEFAMRAANAGNLELECKQVTPSFAVAHQYAQTHSYAVQRMNIQAPMDASFPRHLDFPLRLLSNLTPSELLKMRPDQSLKSFPTPVYK